MNSNAKKWVNALRSGKYKQGKRYLHNVGDNTYCCLGVACELAEQEGIVTSVSRLVGSNESATNYFEEGSYEGSYEGGYSILPETVRIWLGLRTREGESLNSGYALTYLNDHKDYSFEEIATELEKDSGYFKED